jgi:hypothetical protein
MAGEETPGEREAKALRLAEDRGRREQAIDGRLHDHESQLRVLDGNLRGMEVELRGVKEAVQTMGADARRRDAVSEALAKAAQDLASKQVSTRTFLLGLASLMGLVISLYLSAGGHIG